MVLPPENDFGNIEYKRKLFNIDNNRFEELKTQMLFRINEGNGKCIYYLGINDDGSIYDLTLKEKNETFKNIKNLVNSLSLKINKIENIQINKNEKDIKNYFKISISLKKKICLEKKLEFYYWDLQILVKQLL